MKGSIENIPVVAEMKIHLKIQQAALETAETFRRSTRAREFTEQEVREIVDDKRPAGFLIKLNSINVVKTKS